MKKSGPKKETRQLVKLTAAWQRQTGSLSATCHPVSWTNTNKVYVILPFHCFRTKASKGKEPYPADFKPALRNKNIMGDRVPELMRSGWEQEWRSG